METWAGKDEWGDYGQEKYVLIYCNTNAIIEIKRIYTRYPGNEKIIKQDI